jgi:hypothetical protein
MLASYSLVGPTTIRAQNVTLLPSKPTVNEANQSTNPTRIAVPVSASSDLGGADQQGVSPTLGFQLWQRDKFFIGAFFSIAATDNTVSDHYGSFVLNPPLKGNSFYVSGNYLYPLFQSHKSCSTTCPPSPVLVGVGGRWGTTSATFAYTPTGGTQQEQAGFGTVASVTAQLVSKSFDAKFGDIDGEFQLGFEAGPTWRGLGGDLGQNDAFRSQVLGTTVSRFTGYEMTFFVRVNTVQPFARFSHFGQPSGVVIPGLTGNQVVWGVNVAASIFQTKSGSGS